jgi:heme A synthase
VAIGNLLGGLVTFAIAARLVSPPMPSDRVLNPVAIGVALLLSAQIISGGLVSAAQAGLACTDIRQCIEQSSAGGWGWAALNPWREPAFAVGTPHVEGALAQLLHRLVSLAVAPALACLGVLAVQKGRRRDGLAVLLLVVCVVALGLVSGSTGLPLMPVLLHNLATALLFAAVVRLA